MTKYFIVAWLSLYLNGEHVKTDNIVNTAHEFNTMSECVMYTEGSKIALNVQVEKYLDYIHKDHDYTIDEISCTDSETIKQLSKNQ